MTPSSPFQPLRPRPALGWVVIGLAAVGAAVLVWRWSGRAAPTTQAGGHDMSTMAAGSGAARQVTLGASDQRLIGITFAAVDTAPLARRVRTVGIVATDESRLAAVSAKVDGWVERLTVDFTGQRVVRGQLLLDLYSPMVVAALEELLLGHRLLRELADGTPEARRAAEDLIAASRRRLGYWDVPAETIAQVEATGVAARTFPVAAPSDGFALEKAVVVGQRVMAGEPLYRLADLTTVWIEGEVYERDLGSLHPGDRAVARFTALPGVVRSGRVAYLYPVVDPATRTARIRVEVSNRDLALRPGMYATLEVEGPPRPALSIPRSAALVTGQRTLVFLKRPDGRFEPREVTLGPPDDDRYEILAGLTRGDTVVASGTFLLDAESNLGTMLGGMGGMPGMDMAPAPAKTPSSAPPRTR